ncbi:MAG: hypothetical protein V1806_17510, partial [Pseudomonadota bacterium]
MSARDMNNLPGPGLAPGPGARLRLPTWAAVAWLLLAAGPALAHGVVLSQARGQAVLSIAEYQGGEPMAFAKVRVLEPQGQTYQVGHADAQGRFAW